MPKYIFPDCYDSDNTKEFPTILSAVFANRIFGIEKNSSGNFELVERCDEYFGITLTPEQLKELGEELIALSKLKIW